MNFHNTTYCSRLSLNKGNNTNYMQNDSKYLNNFQWYPEIHFRFRVKLIFYYYYCLGSKLFYIVKIIWWNPEAVTRRCFAKKVFLGLRSATLLKKRLWHKCFLGCNFIKKETLAQVFSCEFCKISKNTFSYRTPPVAASRNQIFKA